MTGDELRRAMRSIGNSISATQPKQQTGYNRPVEGPIDDYAPTNPQTRLTTPTTAPQPWTISAIPAQSPKIGYTRPVEGTVNDAPQPLNPRLLELARSEGQALSPQPTTQPIQQLAPQQPTQPLQQPSQPTTPIPTAPRAPYTPTTLPISDNSNLYNQLFDAERQKQVALLNQQLEQSKLRLQQEQQKLGATALDATTRANVQDYMARSAMEKATAQQGLGTSGARYQGDIAQNVATQGALGNIERQRLEGLADINRRGSEAQLARDFGLTQVEGELGTKRLQTMIEETQKRQALEREDALRNMSWEREDTIRQERDAREVQLMQMGWNREDSQRQAEKEYQEKIRQENILLEDKRRQEDIALEEARRKEGIALEDKRLQESRAYNERIQAQRDARELELMQLGWSREDARTKANQEQKALDDARAIEMGTTGRFSGDYQAEINRRLATPDPSDDYLIPQLQAERQQKIATGQEDTRKTELANIGQYSNDFQAEINRRQGTSDTSDDWLIPYLQSARQEKIASMAQSQEKSETKRKADILSIAQKKVDDYIPLNAEEAASLGVKVGYVKPKSSGSKKTGPSGVSVFGDPIK